MLLCQILWHLRKQGCNSSIWWWRWWDAWRGDLGGAQDPGSSVPQGTPAMDSGSGLQNFTQEGDEAEEAPGVGEQMMPWFYLPNLSLYRYNDW